MPEMNGYELASQLREMMPQVKLIAITGWGQTGDIRRSKEAGFNHHLVKPVNLEAVRRLVEE